MCLCVCVFVCSCMRVDGMSMGGVCPGLTHLPLVKGSSVLTQKWTLRPLPLPAQEGSSLSSTRAVPS